MIMSAFLTFKNVEFSLVRSVDLIALNVLTLQNKTYRKKCPISSVFSASRFIISK